MCVKVNAQYSSAVNEESLPFTVYKAEDDRLTLEDVLNSSKKFLGSESFQEKTDTKDVYWIRLHLKELKFSLGKDVYLKHNSFDYGEIYFLNGNNTNEKIGLFDSNSISERIPYDNYYSEIKIDADKLNGEEFLYLKVKRVTFYEDIKNWNFHLSSRSNNNSLAGSGTRSSMLYYIFIGISIVAFIWSLSFYLMLKRAEYFYYSLYTFTNCINICGEKLGIYELMFHSYELQYWYSHSMLFTINMIYCVYIVKYLGSKENYPVFHLILKSVIVFNIAISISILVFYFTNSNLSVYFNSIYYIYYLSTIPLLLYLLYVAKNPLAYFVFFATMCLVIACLARVYFATPEDGLYLDSFYYVIIGASIETIIFVFGLNYTARNQLLEQFRLEEVAHLNEAKALRAQISPHFIFNSLGSIQNFIARNESISALKYLSKFSRLMRNVLESSIENKVVLAEEIKMLQDYLELESLRFSNTFSYAINLEEELDENSIEVPFMILQPFVENAIVHGLLPKKDGEKRLTISFKKEDDIVVCEVDDTGVGRTFVEKEGYAQIKKKKSRGIEVTKKRLENLRISAEPIQIVDKTDDQGNPLGTKVIIKVPV